MGALCWPFEDSAVEILRIWLVPREIQKVREFDSPCVHQRETYGRATRAPAHTGRGGAATRSRGAQHLSRTASTHTRVLFSKNTPTAKLANMSNQNGQLRPRPLTGRKLKWTTKKLRLFFKLVKLHGAVSPAAEIVNIPGSTARGTLHEGRTLLESYGDERPAPEHADRFPTWFARMTQHCLAVWEVSKLGAITNADASGKRPAAGAMWRLERAIATDYGPPVQVTIEAEGAAALALWARESRRGHQSALPLPISQHGSGSDVPQTEAGGGGRGGAGTEDGLTTSEGASESDSEQAGEVEWVEVDS